MASNCASFEINVTFSLFTVIVAVPVSRVACPLFVKLKINLTVSPASSKLFPLPFSVSLIPTKAIVGAGALAVTYIEPLLVSQLSAVIV